jgi:hypothetical protein
VCVCVRERDRKGKRKNNHDGGIKRTVSVLLFLFESTDSIEIKRGGGRERGR